MENNNEVKKQALSPKLWIIIGVLAVVAVIVILVSAMQEEPVSVSNLTKPFKGAETEEIDESLIIPLEEEEAREAGEVRVAERVENRIEGDQVVNRQGESVRTDVRPMDSTAPRASGPVDGDNLSSDTIQLSASTSSGWSPNEFTVEAGKALTIAVSGEGSGNYILKFESPLLSAVSLGVGPGETREISFNAPSEPGEYTFYSAMPGHSRMGLVGKMIVE